MNESNVTMVAQFPAPIHREFECILAFTGIVVFAVPSFLANILIAAAILNSRELRQEPTYMAMTVLAFVDLLHSFVAVYPLGGAILTNRNQPSFERRLIAINIVYPAWYATCICYMTIAINRWLKICHSDLNELLFSGRKMIVWMSTWPFLTLMLMAPMLSGKCCPLDFTPSLWLLRYQVGREYEFNYQLAVCYVTSASTTVVSCIVYPAIYFKIRSIKKQLIGNNKHCQSRIKQSDIKLALQFTLLTIVFTFTWITVHIEASLGPERAHGVLCYMGILAYAVMSGLNPLVYLTMNNSMREAAANVLGDVKHFVFGQTRTPHVFNQQRKWESKSQESRTGDIVLTFQSPLTPTHSDPL